MLGFKYNVIFPFGFEAPAKYASFLLFCLYVFNSPWCPKLIHFSSSETLSDPIGKLSPFVAQGVQFPL